jgi:hypothetical protein
VKHSVFASIVIGLVICLSLSTYAATYGGGSGTSADPYLIYTAGQMNTIGTDPNDWNDYFKLMADINMSAYTGTQYNIIGNEGTAFTGTFDGNEHIISNLTYTTTAAVNYVGLFGYINGAAIQNLGIENVSLSTGGSWVGGLAGYKSGTVTACYVKGGSVSGDWAVGGLIGNNEEGSVEDCYATNSVHSTGSFSGGLIGRNWVGTVSGCYSTGAVNGTNFVGGFAGWSLEGSYFTACFWDTQTSGQANGMGEGSSTGIVGKTTDQMLSTFTDAGWDFSATDGDPANWEMPVSSYPHLVWEPYGGGSGTAEDPYQIWTAEQMNTIGLNPGHWGKCFILTTDIDMSIYTGTQYNIIGNDTTQFTGSFDGNGHVILNLTYTTTAYANAVALFGCARNSTICNLGLENVLLSRGSNYTAGLVGRNFGGTITSCYVTGSISGYNTFGGLVGDNTSGIITACYVIGSVGGMGTGGGLVGTNIGTITSCYTSASVSTSSVYSYIGGLVGLFNGGTVTACYATGSVSASSDYCYVGGLVGMNSYGTITNCYATGFVSGSGNWVAGLVGYDRIPDAITSCFWDTQTSGKTIGVGNGTSTGVTGKTTAQMKMLSTFTDVNWDFVEVWGIADGQTYPYLKPASDINPADINYSGTVDMEDLAILAAHWLEGV